MNTTPDIYLYPRLPRPVSRTIIAQSENLAPLELRQAATLTHPDAAPSATGGTPVPISILSKVQEEIRQIADGFGFPKPLSQAAQQKVDRSCGTFLLQRMGVIPADAAEEGVWSFLTLVVLPEFGPWRFPGRTEERLIGKPRNVLRRLWWRAWTLGPDLDWAPEGCTPFQEDEFVQIMERTSISGNRRTARAFKQAIWRAERAGIPMSRSAVVRDLMPRLRAIRSYLCLDALSDLELDNLLDDLLDQMLEAKGHLSGRSQEI